MNRTFMALAILLFCAAPARLVAQQSGTPIAVLDVNKVFAENIRFQQALEDIKNDIRAYEAEVVRNRKRITELRERLATFNSSSPEYRELEKEGAKLTADLQIDMTLKKKEFMEREAKLYFHAYNELAGIVSDHSVRTGIAMVIRYHGEEIDPDERNSVLAGVNRPIVYHQPQLDITAAIIERVNRGVVPPGTTTGRAGPQIPVRRQ